MLLFPLMKIKAVQINEISLSLLKNESQETRPIKRCPVAAPIIGIENNTLLRLQEASASTYNVEIYQDGVLVFSSFWIFQVEELELPSDLRGNLKIVMSIGKNRFVGSFSID